MIVCPAERLEHDLLKFRRHADAVVLDGKFIAAQLRETIRFFLDREGDVSSIRGVLDGVAHQVHKDLLDAQAVAADGLVLDVLHVDFELMVVLVDCRFCEGEQVIDQLRQAEILLGKAHPPALDPGHVQHFVDQAQQMAARLGDLAKAFDDFVLIFDVGPRNGRQAHDGVHRRPDVVGHIGEEIRLGAACVLGCAVRFLQRLVGFDLGLFLLRHIHRRQQNFDQLRAVPLQRDERRDLIRVFVQCAVFKFVDVVLALQIPADIFRRDERIQCVQRFQCLILCNDLLHKTMVGSGRRIDPFTLQVIELIAVIFQIADDEAVQQAHHALDQQLHGCVVRSHLHPLCRLCFGLCDVPQKDHRIVRVPDLTAHDHIADPSFLPIQNDAALLTQLRLKPL